MVNARVYAPAGFILRLRAFVVDFVVLAILGLILLALVNLPQPDPARQLELTMRVLKDSTALRTSSPKVMDELAEMARPQRFAGWLNVALCAAYFILFHGLAGTTPGKSLNGLRVMRRDGRLPGIGPAALRYFIYFLTAKLAYGVFTMPFDRERRALHDMAAGTNVYRELRWR